MKALDIMCVKRDRSLQLKTNSSSIKIRNVISTADLKQHVDARIFKQYTWGRYDTETYGGTCGYVKDITMRGRVIIFLSRKMISIGADSISQSLEQLKRAKFSSFLEAGSIQDVTLHPIVQNIVATLDLLWYYKIYRITFMNQNHFQELTTEQLMVQQH